MGGMVQRLWRGVIDVLKRAQMALDLPWLALRAKLRLCGCTRCSATIWMGKSSDKQDGYFGGRGEVMIVAARR